MYRYNEEDEIYTFDGDLEQYLLNIGVEAEYIERMKTKILQQSKDRYYSSKYHEIGSSERETKLVPLSKVIGTSRCTVGDSVFDNVRTMKNGEREPSRFQSCFSLLNKMSLEELKESYKKACLVEMDYYKEDDQYYLTSDGNHRTLTAMLLGAESIKAIVTTMYCDFTKKDKCLTVERFYKDFNIIQMNKTYAGIEIIFKDSDDYYVVNGFSARTNEDCYEYISKLSGEIQEDRKWLKIWIRLPKMVRNILAVFCDNKRIIQYIKRSHDAHWNNRIEIYDF